ncbi:MAG: Cna B-type domain-containing protein [Clostridia bacterium]|nr:Cna B-type domain-containing protein [Clostridia bacterium]
MRAGKRPKRITIQLKDGQEVVEEAELSEENNWTYEFEVLKYDSLGNEIEYTVDEEFISEFYVKEIVGGKITNRFVVPEDKVKIVGTKKWEDNANEAGKRPESIVLQVKIGEEVITEAVVTEKNNWSYEFELAKYDSLGNEIEYTIDEKEVGSKFYEKVESEEENVVVNRFVVPDEKVEIWVSKKWEDENDKYGIRPESVILQVKVGEEVVAEAEVKEDSNWKYKFEVPKYDKLGNEIEYVIDERETNEGELKNYTKEIKENEIVNISTYEPPTDTSDFNVWIYIVIFLIAIVGVVVGIVVVTNNKKNIEKTK